MSKYVEFYKLIQLEYIGMAGFAEWGINSTQSECGFKQENSKIIKIQYSEGYNAAKTKKQVFLMCLPKHLVG